MIADSNNILKKRQSFHKEIRRKKLDDYFKGKRSLFLEGQNSDSSFQKKNYYMEQLLEEIMQQRDFLFNLCTLVNILALEKPFQLLRRGCPCPSEEQIIQFSDKLVYQMLTRTYYHLSSNHNQQVTCLNVVSNLLSDSLCQNVRYVKLITQFIDNIIGDLSSRDPEQKETLEMCYVVSNLMGKNILSANQFQLEKLLQWCQQGIAEILQNEYVFEAITRGTCIFFMEVDKKYNPKQTHLITEHFINSRLIILENCIKQCQPNFGTKYLIANIRLITQNVIYAHKILIENEKQFRRLVKNLFIIIYKRTSQKLAISCFQLLISLVSLYKTPPSLNENDSESKQTIQLINKNIRQMKILILSEHFRTMNQIISVMDRTTKILCLTMLNKLLDEQILSQHNEIQNSKRMSCSNQAIQVYRYILSDNGLENLIISLINNFSDDFEIMLRVCKICELIVDWTEGHMIDTIIFRLQQVDCQRHQFKNEVSVSIQNILRKYSFHNKDRQKQELLI